MKFYSKIFKVNKKIPLDKFIDKALYDFEYGYYMNKNPFGSDGDFITAPKISILFSEIIAIWCIAFWKKLKCPEKINIVELGPGDGSLSLGLIKTFKNFKKFHKSYNLKLLEKSTYLIQVQKKKIISDKVKWIDNLYEIKNGPVIIIANEFFDALPIKQYILKNKTWHERYVKADKNNNLTFLDKKILLPNFNEICMFDLSKKQNFIEFSIDEINYIKKISKVVKKFDGGFLCFDYGYKKREMFNSLQSVKNHIYSDVLSNPGSKDITHHINFNLLSNLIKKLDLQFEGITNQGTFLKKMGIVERANILTKDTTFKYKSNVFYRLKRLIHPNEMGKIFKVMFFKKKGTRFNLGFN